MRKQMLYSFAAILLFFSANMVCMQKEVQKPKKQESNSFEKIHRLLSNKHKKPFTMVEIGYTPDRSFSLIAAKKYPKSQFIVLEWRDIYKGYLESYSKYLGNLDFKPLKKKDEIKNSLEEISKERNNIEFILLLDVFRKFKYKLRGHLGDIAKAGDNVIVEAPKEQIKRMYSRPESPEVLVENHPQMCLLKK